MLDKKKAKQRLLTNSERARRGIGHSSACPLCGHEIEDILDVICDCSKAKEVWMLVVPSEKSTRFFSDPIQIWFFTNLCCHDKLQDKGITWSCLFGIIAWRLWKNRNLFIFQDIIWTVYETIKTSLSWAQHFESLFGVVRFTAISFETSYRLADNLVHLFTDEAVARDSGSASVGGVVRDRSGNWILGYTYYLGRCSPLEAEFWGIFDGILILLK
ncbi:hypothetical protein PVK06_044803 [Gossypium arboreum]|uniref:Reverse transcriptase zinc-binding domain-containing protein n=1 Tax=Gossypium arboreum TaxID=29729 RepID=A0ABR0MSR7_GOSAR|nr:hypothetical protein PVK06_044803 [Gossypium arboreum]